MCDETPCIPSSNLPPIRVSDEDRRRFMKGLISLPLATVLAGEGLAAIAADTLETVTLDVGGQDQVSGALALPNGEGPHPTVLLIHEWWGLNDQIKSVAAEFAREGYVALAIDLYDGKVATDRDGARALISKVDADRATRQLSAAIKWLEGHKLGNGRVGTVGWCFGGGWSLNSAIAAPVDATIIYYGRVTRTPEDLANLKGPVLGHFGTRDRGINREMVSGFEANMAAAQKSDSLTVHWYEADHGFANPTGARYDEENAALAWRRTLDFFAANLAG